MTDNTDWTIALKTLKEDLEIGDDAIGLLALRLKYRLEDISNVAAESITGGGDDKKCDIIYIDKELQIAVVAQCYVSKKSRQAAPSNKASDLNTALSWLLTRDINALPEGLNARADELRSAIKAGEIKQFYIWYVHNLPRSKNVSEELATVEHSARVALSKFEHGNEINIFAEEIGYGELEKLYRQAERPIIVTDELKTYVNDAIELHGDGWSTLVTAVSGTWLYKLFQRHQTDLFSANLRGYLGSRLSDSNINNGIKTTALEEAGNFFVYNNGVTGLVFDYEVGRKQKGKRLLTITGLSIVNGAQTTGSLGSLGSVPPDDILVPIRFVKADKDSIVSSIVRYNNSQNKLQAADFRSTDPIQDRLRREFEVVPDASYEGGRRGGASDTIKRSKYTLPSYTVGQSLAAFHGDPVTAYDKKSDIWTSENLYRRVFTERTSARHIVFCYSLLEEINLRKIRLAQKARVDVNQLTQAEKGNLEFLNRKGASYLLVHLIASAIETMIDRPVPNRSDLCFSANLSPSKGSDKWKSIVDLFLSLSSQMDGGFSRGRISNDTVTKVTPIFTGVITSLRHIHSATFEKFKKDVVLNTV